MVPTDQLMNDRGQERGRENLSTLSPYFISTKRLYTVVREPCSLGLPTTSTVRTVSGPLVGGSLWLVVVCLLTVPGGHADVDGVHLVLLKRALLHLKQGRGEREGDGCE